MSKHKKNKSTYNSTKSKPSDIVKLYESTSSNPFRFLAYRDIPKLIKKYVIGSNALDYGSGTGISSNFLYNEGFDVIGVDVNNNMLDEAKKNYPNIDFYLIKNGKIPLIDNQFDFIFSSFVLFELKNSSQIINYLKEAKRVMKNNATMIAITGSEHLYSKNWYLWDINFPENVNLKSGNKAKLLLKDLNMEFIDYYWEEKDYLKFFQKAGLNIIDIIYPLGKKDEPFSWKDELKYPPFVIFIAKAS